MSTLVRFMVVVSWIVALGVGAVQAEQATTAQPAVDPAKEAAMAAMKQLGSPSEGHKALEPFVGNWTYTLTWKMAPEAPSETMTGASTNRFIYGGRFLQQDVRGATEGQPPFEGTGITGYDNIRKEYQSIWFDNMSTGLMVSTGQYDAATKTLTEQGDFSCPMTGEAHRQFRAMWKIVDSTHMTYESYTRVADGKEFKSMEIQYTRTQ